MVFGKYKAPKFAKVQQAEEPEEIEETVEEEIEEEPEETKKKVSSDSKKLFKQEKQKEKRLATIIAEEIIEDGRVRTVFISSESLGGAGKTFDLDE